MTNDSAETVAPDIHDRVKEAYDGLLGEKLQKQTRKRMHWIRDNVKGQVVLDIGCSQGVGPILLGRQGISVTGIDISQKSVDEANEALRSEPEAVQKNVTFKRADFLAYESGQTGLDTITITEVLEHLDEPEPFIEKSYNLLSPDGTLIVTVPFGINDHPDHKKTYYFHDLYTILYRYFDLQEVTILGRWIGVVASKRASPEHQTATTVDMEQLRKIEAAFYQIDREGIELSSLYRGQRDNANQKYKELWDKVRELSDQITRLNGVVNMERQKSGQLQQKINRYENFAPIRIGRYLKRRVSSAKNKVTGAFNTVTAMPGLSVLFNRTVDKDTEKRDIRLDKPQAKNLVISYCFTPYVDTSAIVMAKRIIDNNKTVDVVYADMSSVRGRDEDLTSLTSALVSNRIELALSSVSFSSWDSIQSFSEQMMRVIESNKLEQYETIYSRAMWPASHFAAFDYKRAYPSTRWIAEFSDPLLFDIHSKERISKISNKNYILEIDQALKEKNITLPKNNNLFFWCEYLPYLFADELIFTNRNQLKYMVERLEPWLQDIVRSKATIKNQPVLAENYYHKKESDYKLESAKVNLAYFGAFYETRKLNDIVLAVKELAANDGADRVCFHIFTNHKDELQKLVDEEKLSDNFRINAYVGFLEFLNLTTKFDCLVLNDAITKPHKPINPYLPSKLSDYLGSKTPIWAIYEDSSIIQSASDIAYKSPIGEISQSREVLKQIIRDCSGNG
ncbi:MAG: methyltransferase domain-containing protein [Gammaproteobacteria bacterium]|nr:methyltransferase domain-containing protein [Gammaproteobacteria bacterium]